MDHPLLIHTTIRTDMDHPLLVHATVRTAMDHPLLVHATTRTAPFLDPFPGHHLDRPILIHATTSTALDRPILIHADTSTALDHPLVIHANARTSTLTALQRTLAIVTPSPHMRDDHIGETPPSRGRTCWAADRRLMRPGTPKVTITGTKTSG
jgi:hypothetical protein